MLKGLSAKNRETFQKLNRNLVDLLRAETNTILYALDNI